MQQSRTITPVLNDNDCSHFFTLRNVSLKDITAVVVITVVED